MTVRDLATHTTLAYGCQYTGVAQRSNNGDDYDDDDDDGDDDDDDDDDDDEDDDNRREWRCGTRTLTG